jgi:hypothetical protein
MVRKLWLAATPFVAAAALVMPATATASVESSTYHADFTANDVSGAHDGTWYGTASYSTGFTGKATDGAFSFNGDGSEILMDPTVGSFGTRPATIKFDFQSSYSATEGSIMGERSGCYNVPEGWWDVRIDTAGHLVVEFGGNTYIALNGTHDIADGQWHRVVIHRDNTGVTVSVDDQLDAQGSVSPANIQPSVPFGIDNSPCIYEDPTQPLQGNVDEVSISYVSSSNNAGG